MTTTAEICWLAGLLEGEACFQFSCSPLITVQMTDRDVLERVSALTGAKVTGPYQPKNPRAKQTWVVRLSGIRGAGWMMTLYALLGTRRQEKIREVLAMWKATPLGPRHKHGVKCHPDRPRKGHGLCNACYQRARKQAVAA